MTLLPRDDLPAIRARVWEALGDGAAGRNGFSKLTLGTIGPGGPRQRMVVLRNAGDWDVRIWTDRRSAKCAEIAADPRVVLSGWDSALSLQLILTGRARVLTDDPEVSAAWSRVTRHQNRDYGATAPGTVLDRPEDVVPPETPAAAEAAFAVIAVTVERVEWLQIARAGHRRARISAEGGAVWLAP